MVEPMFQVGSKHPRVFIERDELAGWIADASGGKPVPPGMIRLIYKIYRCASFSVSTAFSLCVSVCVCSNAPLLLLLLSFCSSFFLTPSMV
jgi:hypothetical protein